ncbi:hypothetical protein [Maribacter sp. 2-571]|uniref:hypothetical protein n=1 Tax=Maribacter sp. 2-571 TaxID=3417569 RepID=UPI003D32F801
MRQYKKALEYLELAKTYGANTKNDIYYAEYEHMVYYKNGLFNKTIKSIEKAHTFGKRFKNNVSLKKTYEAAKSKLDSIRLAKYK